MRNKIALKLLAFFGAALLLFALISSLLFGAMFSKAVIDNKKKDMLRQAQSLASSLESSLSGAPGMRGMGGPGGRFGNIINVLTQSQDNIWVLNEKMEFLSSGRMMGKTLTYDNLPPDAERLVREVYSGGSPFSEAFSDLMGYPSLTVGVPIFQEGDVVGALLVHDAVSGIDEAAKQGQTILLLSGSIALLVAVLLSVGLSFGFTKPIAKIEAAARKMMSGDYMSRTGVALNNEIGSLAKSLDALGEELQAASTLKARQEQQRNDFLASVTHELRTPVTVLRGSLEALDEGVVKEESQVKEYHSQMLKETQSLQRLVNDLMDLARLQNADFPIEKSPLLLQEVVKDALRAGERLADKKGITISRELTNKPLTMEGDYARLKQMLLIVLDNAIKFSPNGNAVHVSLTGQAIIITDQGPGIPKDELPHVFDRFRTSRSVDNREGSGLGLAIAKQIALRHGMGIQVESEEGQGTKVSFTWQSNAPVARSDESRPLCLKTQWRIAGQLFLHIFILQIGKAQQAAFTFKARAHFANQWPGVDDEVVRHIGAALLNPFLGQLARGIGHQIQRHMVIAHLIGLV